jgi:long-chain acyl-CoA synthetase
MSTFYQWIFNTDLQEEKTVLSTFHQNYTLSDIRNETEKYKAMLKELGSIKGKRIGLMIPQILPYLSLFLAVNDLGGVVIPLSPQFRKQDLTSVLELLDPHIVFSGAINTQVEKSIEEWAIQSGKYTILYQSYNYKEWTERTFGARTREVERESMDIIACSSGSTGVPKGIVLNMNAWKHWLDGITEKSRLEKKDAVFLIVPPTAPYGIAWLFCNLKKGARMVVPDSFDVFQIVNYLKTDTCNKIVSTPSVFKSIYTFAEKMDVTILRKFEMTVFSGEAITSDFIGSLIEMEKCQHVGLYGLSEAGLLMYCEDLRKLEWEVAPLVNFRMEDAGDQQIGELIFQSPASFSGYYRRPDLTDEVFTKEGWFFTGDLGRLLENGKVQFIGRKKDIIKKGGQQIVPGEVERILLQHPDVKEAVVIGLPHPVYGEEVVAFVVGKKEMEVTELYAFCSERIAKFKVPNQIHQVDHIPINQGKADKLTLKNMIRNKL